jgi:hypothetical protein
VPELPFAQVMVHVVWPFGQSHAVPASALPTPQVTCPLSQWPAVPFGHVREQDVCPFAHAQARPVPESTTVTSQ